MLSVSGDIILFVVEGEKDCEIINSLTQRYDIDDSITQPLIYRSNIYQLFNVLQKELKKFEGEDEFDFEVLNTSQILKDIATDEDRKTMTYHTKDIAEIYLFFDLDGHTPQARKNQTCINEMLELFDDAFDKGKLYISYPMVEAYKHPFGKENLVPLNNKPKYKRVVSDLCVKFGEELNNVSKINRVLWDKIFINHLKDINDLVFNILEMPTVYFEKDFAQNKIYQNQLSKHITPHQ